jgi:tetratricopeptide (TPR) repeat protein
MVEVPDHAFVRWDDGTTRLNLETTDAGAPFDDDAAKEKWGKVPASLMKKEAVAVVLSNLSALYLLDDSGAPDPRGLRDAERAVTLCPRLVSGWLNRAAAFLKLDAPRLSEARASVERALAIDPGSANARWSAARVRHAAGEEEAALEWTEKALEADPQMAVARAGKVEFLLVLGRYDEAVTTADGYHLPALGLKARILGSRPDWREFLAKEAPDPREDPGPWLYAAELQLEGNAQHAASPESADALLGEVSYLAKERFHFSKKRYEELRARVDATLGK